MEAVLHPLISSTMSLSPFLSHPPPPPQPPIPPLLSGFWGHSLLFFLFDWQAWSQVSYPVWRRVLLCFKCSKFSSFCFQMQDKTVTHANFSWKINLFLIANVISPSTSKNMPSGHALIVNVLIRLHRCTVWPGLSLSATRITGYYRMYHWRANARMRPYRCAGWCESAHFAHARRYFFTWCILQCLWFT